MSTFTCCPGSVRCGRGPQSLVGRVVTVVGGCLCVRLPAHALVITMEHRLARLHTVMAVGRHREPLNAFIRALIPSEGLHVSVAAVG